MGYFQVNLLKSENYTFYIIPAFEHVSQSTARNNIPVSIITELCDLTYIFDTYLAIERSPRAVTPVFSFFYLLLLKLMAPVLLRESISLYLNNKETKEKKNEKEEKGRLGRKGKKGKKEN